MKTLKLNHKILTSVGIILSMLFFVLFFTACSEDDDVPEIINEEELITTMKVLLTPANSGQTITLSYQDLDGDGPGEPIVESGTLDANTTYVGTIVLLNETEEPSEDITEEVGEEGAEHQFFFSNTFEAETVYLDEDKNGNPIGIRFGLNHPQPGEGSFTITLRHEPNKEAKGVSEGNIENAGGETDISVTFGVEVQ